MIPLLLIKPQNQVFDAELAHYPKPNLESIVAFSFSFVKEDPDARIDVFLNRLFSEPVVLEVERKWNTSWKQESVDNILKLKGNFTPEFNGANAKDARRFVQEALPQYIAFSAPDWVSRNEEKFLTLDLNAFLSIQMILYNVYYCFYDEKRKWKENDIFDILIISTAAYMGTVITEGFQAEVLKKVKSTAGFATHLEVLTISSLRSG